MKFVMRINARLQFDITTRDFLKKRNLELGGAVQQYVDKEVLRLSEPYIPWMTGRLTRSGQENTIIGTGLIRYQTPYARRLYYNPQYNFNTTFHPMAGAYWFVRMKNAHGEQILEGARKRAGAEQHS